MLGYLKKIIQTPMAQGRSTKVISIRTSRLSIKNSLFNDVYAGAVKPVVMDVTASLQPGLRAVILNP